MFGILNKVKNIVFVSIFIFTPVFAQEAFFLSPQTYNLEKYSSIQQSFPPPAGYKRIKTDSNSFVSYLRNLPVINEKNSVLDFKNNIRVKAGDSSLAAVVPIAISGKRLWQCMDIILALKSDYLIKTGNQHTIEFPLPDGLKLSWPEWQAGFRPEFLGLHFYKKKNAVYNTTVKNFKKYLNTVFSYTNTQTFYHHYPQRAIDSLSPGDFIVKKGRKGHAVLIVDLAVNEYNEKVVLIGQGDTPACQFYLLKNKQGSAWFAISPENDFPLLPIRKKMYWSGLRRFPQ